MNRHMCSTLAAACFCALAGGASVANAIGEAELQQRLTDHFNERMYNSCRTVVLTPEANNVYVGYVEFVNGKRSGLRVVVSGRHIDYAFEEATTSREPGQETGPHRPPGTPEDLHALIDSLQAEIARLKAMCREAGIEPDAVKSSPAPDRAKPPADEGPTVPDEDQGFLVTANLTFAGHLYSRIKREMTYPKVAELLGAEGDRISSSYFDGATNEVCVWANPDDSHICVVFQNGKVLVKTQFGLPGIAPAPDIRPGRVSSVDAERFGTWQLARPLHGRLTWLGLSFGQWLEKVRDGLLKKSSGRPANVDIIEDADQVTVRLTREDDDGTTHRIVIQLRCIGPDGLNLGVPEDVEIEKVCIPVRMRVGDKDSDSSAQTWKAMAALAEWQE